MISNRKILNIIMPFDSHTSYNKCWNRGNPRYGLNKYAKKWKDDLTLVTRNSVVNLNIKTPIQIMYVVIYPRNVSVFDAMSPAKIIQDGICDGIGIDDNSTKVISGPYRGQRAAKGEEPHFKIFVLLDTADIIKYFDLIVSLGSSHD